MKLNFKNLSKTEIKFLNCVLDHGAISDVKISQKTGLSKPTCSRIRKKLEKDLISEYVPIVPLDEVGINVFLVLSFKWTAFSNINLTKQLMLELKKDPHVVFLAAGEGSNTNTVAFIAFEDLEFCHNYMKEFRKNYSEHAHQIDTLLLPAKEVIKHDFTEIIKHSIIGGTQK